MIKEIVEEITINSVTPGTLAKKVGDENEIRVRFAFIGGFKAHELNLSELGETLKTLEIDTPYGKAEKITVVKVADTEVAFLSRHGEKKYRIPGCSINYRANIYALKSIGVEQIVAWSGTGGLNERFQPGDHIVVEDVIDLTSRRPNTFYENNNLGFVRQNPLFCPITREAVLAALEKSGVRPFKFGTYICQEGPRMETVAEVKFYRLIGGDIVGMTLAPEVFLARELEMCYSMFSLVTHYAEGVKPLADYRTAELFEGSLPEEKKTAIETFTVSLPRLLKNILAELKKRQRICKCSEALLKFRKSGEIDSNWRNWPASGS